MKSSNRTATLLLAAVLLFAAAVVHGLNRRVAADTLRAEAASFREAGAGVLLRVLTFIPGSRL